MRHRPFLTPAQWLVVATILIGVFALPAHASNILDDVGQTYYNASSAWEGSLFSIAKSLFLKLALIEILWFAIWWTIERDDPRQFIVQLLRKIMGLLFFWAILLNFDTWIPAIINGFSQAGQTAGGTGALTPSTVLDRGLEITTKILSTANDIGLLDGASGLGKYLVAALAALVILLAFGVIAGQMLVTLIESYIVVNAGVLFLGFAGSRWTTTFAEKFISYSVSVGVKLFVTYLIIGAGQTISNGWGATITTDMVVADYLSILVGAVVYMFLAWQIPALASSMLTGAVSMTLGSAVATAGTMAAGVLGAAGAAAAAGGAAAAAGGAAANGVAGAVKAGSAAINQAKEKGATSMAGIAGGAMGALAGGVADAAKDGIKGLGSESAGGSLANRINDKTAGIKETKAAASVSEPSVSGSQPPAPSAPTDSTQPPEVPPTTDTGNPAAAQPAANAQNVDTTPPEPTRTTPPAPEAVPAAGAPAATTTKPPAAPGTVEASAAPQAAPAPPSATGGPTASPSPRPPEQKDGVFSTLAKHAEALGKTPNDAAGGAGVQINLKHD